MPSFTHDGYMYSSVSIKHQFAHPYQEKILVVKKY